MADHPLLVLGTNNRKKREELEHLLVPLGLDLRPLADFPEAVEVVEDGETFAENARKKAAEQALRLERWVLGEDSGLVVDALGGRPGVYSARYSGRGATDESNNEKLLAELSHVPLPQRGAGYVCHMALADPRGTIRAESQAACRGRILFEPRGTQGFGYDPLFEILEFHKTFAELGLAVKSALSHRARAAQQLIPRLVQLLDSREWN
jgi:XTP/dITP diphosphohydrolase